MAAEDENESTLNRVISPKKLNTDKYNDGNGISISLSDFVCPICLQILIEPVVMPCEHELCGPCFKKNVEEANFLCPFCRMRISSWARRNSRNGTLVDSKRWEQIQNIFPERCKKRLRGEDDDVEDFFDFPPPKRTISQAGELRKEYEEEMRKLQQAREQEMQASEEAIHQLQEEEQRLVRSLEYQALQDEELARKIVAEEKEQSSQGKERLSQPSTTGTPRTNKITKGKKIKAQDTKVSHGHSTLDRWLCPKKQTSAQGSTKNRFDHNSTPSHHTKTNADRQDYNVSSSSTSSDICNFSISKLVNERAKQEEKDFQFALELQKEFDLAAKKAAEIDRKKGTVDAYQLRTISQNEQEESCFDTQT